MGQSTEEPRPTNFIFVRLGDNDFCTGMLKALQIVFEEYQLTLDTREYKTAIILYVLAYQGVHPTELGEPINWERMRHLAQYLEDEMRVTFESEMPTGDYDSGAVALDVHQVTAWSL